MVSWRSAATRTAAALVLVLAAAAGAVRAQTAVYQVNSGGSAAAPYAADGYVTGGTAKSVTTAAIDTSQVTNPAPQAVYQTERYGNFSYAFPGLTAGANYTVRLHFAEVYFSAAGSRKFNVSLNGTQVLSSFDIYAAAGAKNKAIVREFTVAADSAGKITAAFANVVNNAKSSGIEVLTQAAPPSNGPTDNAVASFYGATAYPWAANLAWSRVFNILDYGGNGNGSADNLAAYNAARDAAVAAGGGVVYFPAGTYYFSDDLVLKNGVVLRGVAPVNSNAKLDTFALSSKLTFPAYVPSLSGSGTPNSTAFKKIVTQSPQTDSNLGVVWLDINRAGIKIKGDGLTNTNQNIVVLGVRTNNVAEPDPGVPDATYQNAWQRWSYRFAENIGIQAYANVLVANTRNNDAVTDNFEQPGYVVKNGTANQALNDSGQAVFNYTNHYGISVNRSKSGGYALAGTPSTEPSLFRTGIVIRGNYVFHTMRIAITAAGDGLIIKDNVVRDQSGKVAWVDAPGKKLVGNSATLENRVIDWSGYNVSVTGNDGRVYRHLLKTGPYLSVDGEGILIQECCGGTLVNGVTIENNTVNSYIGLYKMRDINNAVIRGNTLISSGDTYGIYVNANTNGAAYTANNVLIENNSLANGGITLTGSGGSGTGNIIRNNTHSGAGTIVHSCAANVSISGNTGFTVNACN
jgi:hypothetical protein